MEPNQLEHEPKSFLIPIDRDWTLEDLYVFPRAFEQSYYLYYALLPHEEENYTNEIAYTFAQYPWQGGYSAVNFYNKLRYLTPKEHRPKIISMQYASPGWIELYLLLGAAVTIASVVKSICGAINEANKTYNDIYKGMVERELLRIHREREYIDLEREHVKFIDESTNKLSRILQLGDAKQLNKVTGSPYRTLKILMSLYRRIKKIVKYQEKKKIRW